jgi:hypothetical protein
MGKTGKRKFAKMILIGIKEWALIEVEEYNKGDIL